MSYCKYCGGDCPEQVDKNGVSIAKFICDGYAGDIDGLYRESTITTMFKGEYVQVDMVDETIELTVENNVYSRSESLELLEELKRACAIGNIANSMVGEPLDSKSKLHDETGVASSGSYKNHLPRLMEEMENEPVGGMMPVHWKFHTTDDDYEFEDTGGAE